MRPYRLEANLTSQANVTQNKLLSLHTVKYISTMAPLRTLLFVSLASLGSAFAPVANTASKTTR